MNPSTWHIEINGAKAGPFVEAQAIEFIRQGVVRRESRVWRGDEPRAQRADTVAAWFPFFPPAAAPGPPAAPPSGFSPPPNTSTQTVVSDHAVQGARGNAPIAAPPPLPMQNREQLVEAETMLSPPLSPPSYTPAAPATATVVSAPDPWRTAAPQADNPGFAAREPASAAPPPNRLLAIDPATGKARVSFEIPSAEAMSTASLRLVPHTWVFYAVACVAFLLPFLEVSCQDHVALSLSGSDLALGYQTHDLVSHEPIKEDASPLFTLAWLFSGIAAAAAFTQRKKEPTRLAHTCALAAVALLWIGYWTLLAKANGNDDVREMRLHGVIEISTQIGFHLAWLALAAGAGLFFWSRQREPG